MNKINIETYENEKKANYKVYIDGKLELDVKGLKYNNTNELMDWITKSYEKYLQEKQTTKKSINRGTAKYAGNYEIAQAIEMIPKEKPFTSKDIAKIIVDASHPDFTQTHRNISAAFSVFEKTKYPEWLDVMGKQGRSRLYKKNQNASTKQIEDDFRKMTKEYFK